MTTSAEPLLFISGAGLDPWVWDEVRDELPGPTAVAPRPAAGASATLLDYANAAIAAAPDGEFTVVAHSVGGVVAAEVLRIAPERVTAVLGVSAAVPAPAGGSFVSAMPPPNRWLLALALRFAGTRPPESAIRRGLADGLDDALTRRIIDGFTPESKNLYRDRSGGHTWTGPTGYVLTSQDRELPVALQQRFAGRLGAGWRTELLAGHLPMLQCPRLLTDSIRRFVAASKSTP